MLSYLVALPHGLAIVNLSFDMQTGSNKVVVNCSFNNT